MFIGVSFFSIKNRRNGIFRVNNQGELARLWGVAKGNSSMNYEKFSRAMRFVLGNFPHIIIMEHEQSTHLNFVGTTTRGTSWWWSGRSW